MLRKERGGEQKKLILGKKEHEYRSGTGLLSSPLTTALAHGM